MTPRVTISHFTDPACPPDPAWLRLRWQYGDQVDWELRMIVLRPDRAEPWPERGNDATIHACRAVVAARLRWPDRHEALLRELHMLAAAGEMLDDSDTLELAAAQAGLPVAEIAAHCAEPEVEEALRADYKLAGPPEERRYTCPSYELVAGDARVDVPGYRTIEAYETALAKLARELQRRPDPESVEEVLAWAPYPLATAEIASVCDREIPDVRVELARGGARFEPVGADGYWSTVKDR